MAKVVGEVTVTGKKQQKLVEALQDALKKAPPPTGGNDIQHFKLSPSSWSMAASR